MKDVICPWCHGEMLPKSYGQSKFNSRFYYECEVCHATSPQVSWLKPLTSPYHGGPQEAKIVAMSWSGQQYSPLDNF